MSRTNAFLLGIANVVLGVVNAVGPDKGWLNITAICVGWFAAGFCLSGAMWMGDRP